MNEENVANGKVMLQMGKFDLWRLVIFAFP